MENEFTDHVGNKFIIPQMTTPPCAGGTHKIDGIIPTLQDIQYDGRTCECGRIKYIAEGCTCNGSKELKSYPNQ